VRPSSLANSRKPQSSNSKQHLPERPEVTKSKTGQSDSITRNNLPSKIIQNAGKIIQSSTSTYSTLSNKKVAAYQARPLPASPGFEAPKVQNLKTSTLKRPSSKAAIPEYASGADDRVQCRKCKRKFNPDRIQKHQSVCIGPINEFVEKPVPRVQKKRKVGVPLWKKQHLDFINNVRYAKKMTLVQKAGGDIRKIQPPVQHYDPASDYKQCPYCSRKFNQEVALRHIPNCKNIINKPKPPPKAAVRSSSIPVSQSIQCRKCGNRVNPNTKKCPFCR
jgi:DNA-directed RNA polymerase subunit RPC12/RpoP